MSDTELLDQNTEEWLSARMGKITSSRLGELLAKTKSGYSASRENYLTELLLERITGEREEHFESYDMKVGHEREPIARSIYEAQHGVMVEQVGFFDHPSLPMTGGSPDGLVDEWGVIEIKCPKSRTHLETIITRKMPVGYVYQAQWNMECTAREWCDYVSFHPNFPEDRQVVVIRVERDESMLTMIRSEVVSGNAWIDEMIRKLKEV